jgi:hypothetical protein
MEASFAAEPSYDNYEDIKLVGGFSSSGTKSRYQPAYMRTGSQSLLNAPDCAYAALPIRLNRNASDLVERSEKYQPMLTGAKRSGTTALRTGEEDVNQVASFVKTRPPRKAAVLPYGRTYLDNRNMPFHDRDIGGGLFCFPKRRVAKVSRRQG